METDLTARRYHYKYPFIPLQAYSISLSRLNPLLQVLRTRPCRVAAAKRPAAPPPETAERALHSLLETGVR